MWMRGGSAALTLFAIAGLALMAPSGATAATVVNGDFESGTLQGWHLKWATQAGNWFAYKGTAAPISSKRANGEPVQPPPQGTYAATTDEANPDTLILYQDVALRPGYNHRLSLLAYYDSYEPLAIPTPDTLSVGEDLGGQANQQFRIDVIDPAAPLDSLDPADILDTVFRTRAGGPQELRPTVLTADLSPFAGQTVRLRIANAVTEEVFNAGIDAVAIGSAPPGQPFGSKSHGSTSFRLGKVRANKKNGTAILPVLVPGAGSVKAKAAADNAGTSKARALRKPIKPASARAVAASTVQIRLKPTAPALEVLRRKHRLRVKVAVTYKPTDTPAETTTVPVVLKLTARPHRH